MHVHMCTCIYTCTLAQATSASAREDICTPAHAQVRAHTYICTHAARIYMHRHTHIYIYIYAHEDVGPRGEASQQLQPPPLAAAELLNLRGLVTYVSDVR